MKKDKPFDFAAAVLSWFDEHGRKHLPWQQNTTPYRVWVSEIMLQQTRVETVLPYFEKFIKAFPTIQTLAVATESQIFKRWEGLGYYSRARNMHFTAKYIVNELNGNFPNNRAALLKLKKDAKININTEIPEFSEYKFVSLKEVYEHITFFKRTVYKQVLKYFKDEGYI